MGAQPKSFEIIQEDDERSPEIPPHTLDTLLLGLKALPKRTAVALSDCFALITVTTVFCLALMIVPYTPTVFQLVGLGGYALFVIVLNIITRRR